MKFDHRHPVPCVYLKHGAYWLVKHRKWERIGTTLEEALAEYARRVDKRGDGRLPSYLEQAFAYHRAQKTLAKPTIAQYRQSLDTLKRRFAKFDPHQVKGKHVAKLKTDGVDTPNMTNRTLSLFRTLFGYLVEWQLADANPCIGISRLEEGKRKRYLSDAEFFAIRANAGERLKVIMDLQYLTGQRINDVLRINRRQLTPEGIFFKPSKTQNRTGAMICVRWTDELKVAVAQALELQGEIKTLWVLGSRTRRAPDYRTVHEQFTRAAALAGIADARPNDQRAKSATDADSQGHDSQKLLAHGSRAMTERYLRLFKTVLVDGPTFKR